MIRRILCNVVAVFAVLFAYAYWLSIPKSVPEFAIPSQKPNESDRVHHPDGFSMICPRGWTRQARYDLLPQPPTPELIFTRWAESPRCDVDAEMSVKTTNSEFDFSPEAPRGHTPIDFLGHKAWQQILKKTNNGRIDPGYVKINILFNKHNRGWAVSYRLNYYQPEVPEIIEQYLESLIIDEPK